MIPAILKGDTPQPINIIVPDDLAMLTVWYQGTSYDFMDVTSGDTLQLQFPRDNSFKIGTYPLIFVGVGSDGSVRSYPISAKVKITDCPGDVYAVPPIELGSGLIHASDLVPGDSMSDIKATVNRILSYLRRGAVCVVASAAAMCCADVEPLYTTLNDLPGNALVMTNVAEYVQDKAGSGGSVSGFDTNAVLGLIAAATNSITPQSIGAQERFGENPPGFLDAGVRYAYAAGIAYSDGQYRPIEETYAEKYEVEDLHAQVNSLGDHYNEISGTVSAWQTYWDGDDVRVTVTNYYGPKDIPSLYLEQKMPADESNDAPWFKIVWDERTRWIAFMPGYEALCDFVNNHLADRAWGVYDSSTGEYSPDGLLQLSQEQIMISPGMSYQKTVTAGGNAYWILRANDPTTVSGVTSNGFFRIEDFDGNPLIEIVKGDKRIVGANIASIDRAGDDGFSLTFNVNSDAHPDVYFADRLSAGEWHRIESRGAGAWLDWHWEVEWSGAPGAWIASITWKNGISVLPFTPPPPSTGFFRATYESGGNTYIRNNVATSIDKVVVGGIEYTVTVETVNGKKLLVLQ